MGFRIATAFVDVRADDDGLHADLEAKVRAAAESVAARVRVDTDADGLAERVRAAAAEADATTHVHVDVDDAGLSTLDGDAQRLRGGLDGLESSSRRAGSALDDAGNRSENAGRKASNAGNGFRLASVGIGAAAASAIALIPALAAVPGVAAAAAAGIATLASAFFGVGKALHDYGAAQDAVGGGGGGGNTAAQAYSNAVAIRGAEQAIADAKEQAARAAVQSAEQIQNAQRGVDDAERNAAIAARNAADQITAAQQRVAQAAYAGQQAEQAYTNAVYNERQAQVALVNARQAAADQLADTQNAAKDAHLATEKAAVNERQAQLALTAAQGNSLLTADQKLMADIDAREAVQQLADAKQREKEAVEKADAATQAGVDHAPSVLAAQHAAEMAAQATASAQHGVAQAAQQQTDAQAALAKATQAAADQQVNSTEQVAKAEQSLADAQRQADQQREDSAKQVQRAEQNLTDTIKQQQLAADSAGASGGAAANKFAQDYAKLTPAAKAFVDQVLSMRGQLHQLAADAQTATLPGFTQMLKDSEHLFPVFDDGVKRIGKSLSDTATAFGHLFANPAFDASAMQFEQIITGGFGEFTSALPPLLNAIVTDGVQAAPLINAVAQGVHDLVGSGLPAFLTGLTTGASGAAVGVGALFTGVDSLLGPVGTLAGALGGAVGPALGDVVPQVTQFADEIIQSLLPIMPELSQDLRDVAQVFDAVLQILEPIIPVIATDLADGLQAVDPLLRDTATFLHDNQKWLTPVAEGILAVVAAQKAWSGISSTASKVIDGVSGVFTKFGGAAKTAGKEAEDAAGKIGGGGFASKVSGAIPVVGAITTGIIALGTYLRGVYFDGKDASASVDQFTAALLNSESTTDDATLKLDGVSRGMQQLGSRTAGVTDPLAQVGLGLGEVAQHLGFTTTDLKNYDSALANMVQSGNGDRAAAVVAQIASATDAHGKKLVDVTQVLPGYEAAIEKAGVDLQSTARSTDRSKDSTDALGMSINTTKDKFQLMSNTMSQSEALDRYHADLLNLKQAADDNGTSLDNNTTKGLANRQAFGDLANQIQAYAKQLHDSGDTNVDAAVHMQDMIDDLETQAGKFGYSKDKVDAYIKSIGLIPRSVSTDVNWELNVSINQAALAAAGRDIGHVVGHNLVPGQATGGPVVGPGTSTSDSVLRWLSNGEWVVPAAAVDRLGPAAMRQIQQGQVPQVGGTTPQPAAPTINLNYFGPQQPTAEQNAIMMQNLALAVRG